MFHAIMTSTGSECTDFLSAEHFSAEIYFTEPYSDWERPVNKHTNRSIHPSGIQLPEGCFFSGCEKIRIETRCVF